MEWGQLLTDHVLRDPTASEHLRSDGFAVLDLLDAAQVRHLRNEWEKLSERVPIRWDERGFSTTALNAAARVAADVLLQEDIGPVIASAFCDHEVILAAYMVKQSGATAITPHVDWSLVDENQYPSFNCWVALSTIDETNGALGFIPGSHRLVDFPRSPDDPRLDWAKAHYDDHIGDLSICLLLPGQAVVYDSRLIHSSTPNVSTADRIVGSFALAHHATAAGARNELLGRLRQVQYSVS